MKEAAWGKTSELVCVQSIPQILPQAGHRSPDFIKIKSPCIVPTTSRAFNFRNHLTSALETLPTKFSYTAHNCFGGTTPFQFLFRSILISCSGHPPAGGFLWYFLCSSIL